MPFLETAAQQITSVPADSLIERGIAYGKHQFYINNDIFDFIHNKK